MNEIQNLDRDIGEAERRIQDLRSEISDLELELRELNEKLQKAEREQKSLVVGPLLEAIKSTDNKCLTFR